MNDGPVHISKDGSLFYFNRNMSNDDDESKSGIFIKNINDTLYPAIPFLQQYSLQCCSSN